ncbi:MAG: hypothetical protein HY370_10275 [Proteobacteria bacterium]|nr:hypothetical protein [Pseudomonadota bacterium]
MNADFETVIARSSATKQSGAIEQRFWTASPGFRRGCNDMKIIRVHPW